MQHIKVLLVGDDRVGKSSLVMAQSSGSFPAQEPPALLENVTIRFRSPECDEVELGIWDTIGSEDYSRLRPLSYPSTDVFFMCFSLVDRGSFDHIRSTWLPEICHFSPGVPLILVGTKEDSRRDILASGKKQPVVSDSEASELATDPRFATFMPVSSVTGQGLRDLFEEAVHCAFFWKRKSNKYEPLHSTGTRQRRKPCSLM